MQQRGFCQDFRLLENKVKRLEGLIKALQQVDCTITSSLGLKLYALEQLYGQYSVHMLCDALQVSRRTFYNHIHHNKQGSTWHKSVGKNFEKRLSKPMMTAIRSSVWIKSQSFERRRLPGQSGDSQRTHAKYGHYQHPSGCQNYL